MHAAAKSRSDGDENRFAADSNRRTLRTSRAWNAVNPSEKGCREWIRHVTPRGLPA